MKSENLAERVVLATVERTRDENGNDLIWLTKSPDFDIVLHTLDDKAIFELASKINQIKADCMHSYYRARGREIPHIPGGEWKPSTETWIVDEEGNQMLWGKHAQWILNRHNRGGGAKDESRKTLKGEPMTYEEAARRAVNKWSLDYWLARAFA